MRSSCGSRCTSAATKKEQLGSTQTAQSAARFLHVGATHREIRTQGVRRRRAGEQGRRARSITPGRRARPRCGHVVKSRAHAPRSRFAAFCFHPKLDFQLQRALLVTFGLIADWTNADLRAHRMQYATALNIRTKRTPSGCALPPCTPSSCPPPRPAARGDNVNSTTGM